MSFNNVREYSSQESECALIIQRAWRKYQESKDSCPICLKIIAEDISTTKCGHKFCTGCLLKAVQKNHSCPLCRDDLIEDDEVTATPTRDTGDWEQETDVQTGRMYWFNTVTGESRWTPNVDDEVEEHDLGISLTYYDQGYEEGRHHAEEEFRPRMREEIDIATQKAYDDGIVQGRSLANEDIRLLREEIKRLKQSNSRMREDLQFHTQPTRKVLIN